MLSSPQAATPRTAPGSTAAATATPAAGSKGKSSATLPVHVKGPAAAPLNQTLVKKYYSDGDFDPATTLLEDFQKSHATFSREESLMVYKYLGVMYCADQGTREKGKNYFYKLLKIDPDAKILDMYVSIVVQDIFKGTLDELMGQKGASLSGHAEGRQDRLPGPDTKPDYQTFATPKQADARPSSGAVSARKSTAAYWWIGGLVAAAGVAGGYYAYSSASGKAPAPVEIPITP